ncbi:MAG: alkaline phosphatase family protein [Acidobacteriota bacterium]
MARARTTLSRLAVNATLAGFWASALLALLVFYVNSGVSLTTRSFLSVALPVAVVYAPLTGIVWAMLAGMVRLFVAFRIPVPWVGFRTFWRFLVGDFFLVCLAYLHNLDQARDYLPITIQRSLASATLLLVAGTTMLAVDAIWRGLTRRRLRRAAVLAAAILMCGGLFLIRQRYREVRRPSSASEIEVVRPAHAILWLGLDGVTPDDLLPMAADGRLPFLGALLRAGTSAPLTAPRPPRLAAAWATVVTGRNPAAHGVVEPFPFQPAAGSATFRVVPTGTGLRRLLRYGLLGARTAAARPAVPTIDRILARCGYRVIAGGWDTLLEDTRLAGAPAPVAPSPGPDIAEQVERVEEHIRMARSRAGGAVLAVALETALAADMAAGNMVLTHLAAAAGRPEARPAVLLHMSGLDRVAHTFTRYRHPERFGNVSAQDVERFGEVIPDYERFLDAWLGRLSHLLAPEPTVVVVSPYAVGPVGILRRVRQTVLGSSPRSGTHAGAGPGFLLLAGPGVKPGGVLETARSADVLPTLLYLTDLPVGRDMEGEVLDGAVSARFAGRHAVVGPSVW